MTGKGQSHTSDGQDSANGTEIFHNKIRMKFSLTLPMFDNTVMLHI